MLPKNITSILNKYNDSISEEISSINLAITRISDALSTVNSILINEMSSYARNTGINNVEKEKELWNDSLALREYITAISLVQQETKENNLTEISEENNNTLDIFNVIVLSNTRRCSYKSHNVADIVIKIPTVKTDGTILYAEVLSSYCKECKRFTILKDDFKNIKDVILCQVIDETNPYNNDTTDEFLIEQRESLLYKYGYNVQTKADLSSKQRHIILSSVIEANILTRRHIIDHLNTLIERGSKIEKWKLATQKWKEDKYFVQSYKTENLPKAIFDKVILKHSYKK